MDTSKEQTMTYLNPRPPDQGRRTDPGEWHEQIHGRGGERLSFGPVAAAVVLVVLLVIVGMYFAGVDGDVPAQQPAVPAEPEPIAPGD